MGREAKITTSKTKSFDGRRVEATKSGERERGKK